MTTPLNRLPAIKRGWLRAILFCVAYIATLVITSMLAGVAAGVDMLQEETSQPVVFSESLTLLILFISSILAILLAVIFRRYIDKQPVSSMGFEWKNSRHNAWTGLLLAPAILGTGSLILFFNQNLHWTDIIFDAGDFFIALVLTGAIACGEEIAFRGYLLNNLMESMNKIPALLASAVLFTLAHAANPHISFIAVINLFLGGLLLGINYIYTRNLWYAIFFHFSWNFFQGPLLGYEVSGISSQGLLEQSLTGNPLLTGNSFGFEGSLINSILSVLALLALWLIYENRYKKTAVISGS